MKKIGFFLCLFLLIGCTHKENHIQEELNQYNKIVSKVKQSTLTKVKDFNVKLYYSTINQYYRYDLVINNPKLEMKNIQLLCVSTYPKDKYHPSLGIFDQVNYNLKPNYVNKDKGYYKGIQLSGLVSKKSNIKCFIRYNQKQYVFEVNS